jgi:glutaredoxin
MFAGAHSKMIVTLYTREGCHLCDEAKATMLREIDIDDDADLRAMYNDSVPVIFVGANFFSRYRIDAQKFAKVLQAAGGKS